MTLRLRRQLVYNGEVLPEPRIHRQPPNGRGARGHRRSAGLRLAGNSRRLALGNISSLREGDRRAGMGWANGRMMG